MLARTKNAGNEQNNLQPNAKIKKKNSKSSTEHKNFRKKIQNLPTNF